MKLSRQIKRQKKTVVLAIIAYLQMIAVVSLIVFNMPLLASEEVVDKSEITAADFSLETREVLDNEDFVLWLSLSDRMLPVVQSKDNKEYLKLNLAKEEEALGTLFIDKDYSPISYNMVIYGHSARKNNERLTLLKNRNYVQNNRILTIVRDGQEQKYEIIAYFNRELPENEIAYLQGDFRNHSEFVKFLHSAQAHSLLAQEKRDFSLVTNSITLVTCDMSDAAKKRWVVVAIPLV